MHSYSASGDSYQPITIQEAGFGRNTSREKKYEEKINTCDAEEGVPATSWARASHEPRLL